MIVPHLPSPFFQGVNMDKGSQILSRADLNYVIFELVSVMNFTQQEIKNVCASFPFILT